MRNVTKGVKGGEECRVGPDRGHLGKNTPRGVEEIYEVTVRKDQHLETTCRQRHKEGSQGVEGSSKPIFLRCTIRKKKKKKLGVKVFFRRACRLKRERGG